MCHGLGEAKRDTVQDDIDEVMVSHLGIDIESIDIIQVFLDSTCLVGIPNLVKSPVWLVVVTILFPDSVFNLFPGSIPVPISFPPF